MYTVEQINKVGNSLIYLADRVKAPSKTKLIKLIYILEEISIKKYGIPFFNLDYKVWKFGPVANAVYVELSSSPSMLKEFITRDLSDEGNTYIKGIKSFSDDEFTNNDIELLEYVVDKFGESTAKELIEVTHHKESPWYNAALKNDVLNDLLEERISYTNFFVDLAELVKHDERKTMIFHRFRDKIQFREV